MKIKLGMIRASLGRGKGRGTDPFDFQNLQQYTWGNFLKNKYKDPQNFILLRTI